MIYNINIITNKNKGDVNLKYEIKFKEYDVIYSETFNNYSDMYEYLNYIYPYKSVTNIELYIGSDLVDYIDYLG